MKETRILMGMPITVEAVDPAATIEDIDGVFRYLEYVDDKFSTYKPDSEISRLNRKELALEQASEDMQLVFDLADETWHESDGYFDIRCNGGYDPSGIVKGWAIYNAATILKERGLRDLYVEAGGDIQVWGKNSAGKKWRVGIRNPFNMNEIVKVLYVTDCGVATSGTYVRGQHVYNPKKRGEEITEIVSLTVIGPNIYEADRFATAAFAMGRDGILFVESLEGFEGYMIDHGGQATLTSGLERYTNDD